MTIGPVRSSGSSKKRDTSCNVEAHDTKKESHTSTAVIRRLLTAGHAERADDDGGVDGVLVGGHHVHHLLRLEQRAEHAATDVDQQRLTRAAAQRRDSRQQLERRLQTQRVVRRRCNRPHQTAQSDAGNWGPVRRR